MSVHCFKERNPSPVGNGTSFFWPLIFHFTGWAFLANTVHGMLWRTSLSLIFIVHVWPGWTVNKEPASQNVRGRLTSRSFSIPVCIVLDLY